MLTPAGPQARTRALEVLLSGELSPIVDLVAWSPAPDEYEVATASGHLAFTRHHDGVDDDGVERLRFTSRTIAGTAPLARQDPTHFGTLADERASLHPSAQDNSYPHAFEHIAQVFDHVSAPDLVVQHTASHHWGERGGHLGEHGSIDVVQARAPFIAAGAGIERLGITDASCRLIDVAPTMLEVLGCPSVDRTGRRLARQDGHVLHEVVATPGAARHVVAMLLDGTNPNVLYDLAMRGELPYIARLLGDGLAYRYGAFASMPTVTLANHTGILTGSHPGHHGVLHNAWVDRATGAQVVTNSPTTWTTSMRWLDPSVETMHHAVHRAMPGSLSISINEPCDAGADYSVFEQMRNGEDVDRPPPVDSLPDVTERFVRPSKDYRWSSLIDHTAVDQFCGIFGGEHRGRRWATPTFSWVNFTLTDSAFHEGGPYSEIAAASLRDTDARIGRLLDAVDAAGVYDDTAFFLVADHGMELSNPDVRGDWDDALDAAGVAARDEGYGFVYLT